MFAFKNTFTGIPIDFAVCSAVYKSQTIDDETEKDSSGASYLVEEMKFVMKDREEKR